MSALTKIYVTKSNKVYCNKAQTKRLEMDGTVFVHHRITGRIASLEKRILKNFHLISSFAIILQLKFQCMINLGKLY